jgi:hypothetical protein
MGAQKLSDADKAQASAPISGPQAQQVWTVDMT